MNSGTEVKTSQVPNMQVEGIIEPRQAGGPQAVGLAKVTVMTEDEFNKKTQDGEI